MVNVVTEFLSSSHYTYLHQCKLCSASISHGLRLAGMRRARASDLHIGDLVLLVNTLENARKDLIWANLVALL